MSGSLTQTVVFNEIPSDWRAPGTLVEVRPNYNSAGAFAWPTRVLLVGFQTNAGVATPNVPVRIFTEAQSKATFGPGSMLAQMCIAFLRANSTNELWAAAIPEGSGTRSTGTFTFTGTPTAAGTIGVYIGGNRVSLSVFTTDTPTTIATRLAAAINANVDLPVTATSAAGVVTITVRHIGGYSLTGILQLNQGVGEATPPGLTVAVAGMSSATGPAIDCTTLISNIANDWYTDVVIGPNNGGNGIAQWISEAARRYTATGRQDMHLYAHLDTDTYSGATTIGLALNSQNLTVTTSRFAASAPWIWAATVAAVSVFQLTNDPARQLRGLTLPGVVGPATANRWIESERDGLLRTGMSTYVVGRDGSVALDRVITTYQTTSGVADTSWLDIMVPKTVSRIRHDWRTYVSLTYPRSKLADDGSLAAETDPSIVTPRAMHNAWAARCEVYAQNGWIENEAETTKDSVFLRNITDRNRLDARLKVNIIGNLMVFAGALEFNQ